MVCVFLFSKSLRAPYFRHIYHLQDSDDGSPDGNDPLVLARQMAARGITLVLLFAIAKVPTFFLTRPSYSSSWLANQR
jgi:hypothetical protein